MGWLSFSLRDWSDEYTNVRIEIAEPAGGDLVSTVTAKQTALQSAIEGVTLGTVARKYAAIAYSKTGDVRPASDLAQRENGLRIFFQGDTSGNKGNITIGTVDIASLTVAGGGDEVTLADGGVMAALVTALEANMVMPYGASTEDITVTSAFLVGRNS